MPIRTAIATRQGTERNNADAAAIFTAQNGDVGAAVVDLIGHHERAPLVAQLLAETAARIAPQRSGPAALCSAGLLVADPGADDEPEPDGVGVVAVVHPDRHKVISWAGDSHAYGFDGTTLRRCTTPHTMGEQLRWNGTAPEIAEDHDNWILTTLGRSTIATVYTVTCDDPLLILASDGLDDVPHRYLEGLVTEHQHDLQALADALVDAPGEDDAGYRDDVTVIVIA